MTLDDVLNNKLILSLVGTLFTVTVAYVKIQKSVLEKKIDSLIKKISCLECEDKKLRTEAYKLEKRLLEYQVAASSTFVLKEDLHEFKNDIRSMYENSSG